jgi:hypothetical protein
MPICENLKTLEIQEKVEKKAIEKFINNLNHNKLNKIYIKSEN